MMNVLSKNSLRDFNTRLQTFGEQLYRPMPWRDQTDPYGIFLSEIMLQQTQVDRVIPKFKEFVGAFPNIDTLASAPFLDVLRSWSGLGYNRRALWLHDAAKQIKQTFRGEIPSNVASLCTLKGIGPNTACAICVYAFAQPHVFVETNVRAVFIHEFFQDRNDVHDDEIRELVSQALDQDNPRAWYWSVMDYGTYLKKLHPNPSRKSIHHSRQPRFEGSRRQVRGQVLKSLLHEPFVSVEMISKMYEKDVSIVSSIFEEMERDGLLVRDQSGREYRLRS